MSDALLSPFTLRDGLNLARYDWPLPKGKRPRAVVLIVHGLGEHAWRYDTLAQRLNGWGCAARAFDQRGHGESGGKPGVLPHDDALLEDLAELVDDTRHQVALPWGCPLILLGHSLGGLVAATFVLRSMAPVDGLVLSSPAFDAGMTPFQKWLTRLLYRWGPDITVANGLDPQGLSHDQRVVSAYRDDPHVHNRISARLAQFIAVNGPAVVAAAPGWSLPTLLMYAGADRLVRPEGSRAFVAQAPARWVSGLCLEGQFHEIFNEVDPGTAFSTLKDWLNNPLRQGPK